MIKELTCCRCKTVTEFTLMYDEEGHFNYSVEPLVCPACGYGNFTSMFEFSEEAKASWIGSYGTN
jgi:uncharacterized protein (DUF2225 family)